MIARATCSDWAMAIGLFRVPSRSGASRRLPAVGWAGCWSLARPPGRIGRRQSDRVEPRQARVGAGDRLHRVGIQVEQHPQRGLVGLARPGAPASSFTRTVGACSSLSVIRRIDRSISWPTCGSRPPEPPGQPGQLGVHDLGRLRAQRHHGGGHGRGAARRQVGRELLGQDGPHGGDVGVPGQGLAVAAPAASVSRSTTVTPGRSAAPASTSRGRARSSRTSPAPGRSRRAGASRTMSAVITVPGAPVQEMTRSAAAIRAGRSVRSAGVPGHGGRPAAGRGRGCGWRPRWRPRPARAAPATASALIEPAPTTSTERPGQHLLRPSADGPPSGRRAAAARPTLSRLAPARSMPVSACARLPVRSASAPSSDRARSSVPCSRASGQRLPDLAEDLALADDHRVQAAGHREQVLHGAVLVVHVQVRGQLAERDAGVPGQQLADGRHRAVELADLGVDLDPVAGAHHQRSRPRPRRAGRHAAA